MESFIGLIIGVVVFGAIVRSLRSKYVWVDFVFYAIVIIGVIVAWINSGFWYALGIFLLGSVIVSLLLGLGHEEEIRYNGKRYTIECEECGYNHLEILSQVDNCVTTRCKRCGQVKGHYLV